jgi:hypothetical protein
MTERGASGRQLMISRERSQKGMTSQFQVLATII